MRQTFIEAEGKDWEIHLQHLLFAYREVPQESTGFSPFELLYGRRVRGPLDLFHEGWEGEATATDASVIQYVVDLRDRLEMLMGVTQDHLRAAQTKQKQWYDRNARSREFIPGQQVLVLKPTRGNKLMAAWSGPYPVIRKVNEYNYVVQVEPERHKTYHVNMLKEYRAPSMGAVMAICSPLLEDPASNALPDFLGEARQGNTVEQVEIGAQLCARQQVEARDMLAKFRALFTDMPGTTHLTKHPVHTGDLQPLHKHAYRVSAEVKTSMEREIEEMLTVTGDLSLFTNVPLIQQCGG
ncbi:hypothetical protein FKM82_023151 [Ascaphus truei]